MMTMTADNFKALVVENLTKPVCEEWTPSKYDMEYKYNTPRKAKKLDADKAKFDAKLRDDFNRKMDTYNGFINMLDEIVELPVALRDMFIDFIVYNVDLAERLHNEYLKVKEEMFIKYGDILDDDCMAVFHKDDPSYIEQRKVYHSAFSRMTDFIKHGPYVDYCGRKTPFNEEKWNYMVKQHNCLANINIEEYEKDSKVFVDAHDADGYNKGENKEFIIKLCLEKIKGVLADITRVLGGKVEECVMGANWGVGGEFNGIVSKGDKRASFKSFFAGGWNIQRLHIRCRVTLLK